MKAKRLTLRQRIVKRLTKRIKLVRVTHPRKVYPYTGLFGPFDQWEIQWDGHMQTWCSRGRDTMRAHRRNDIQREASRIMSDVRSLRRQGFKVTLPA